MAGTFPGQPIQYADVSPSGRIPAVEARMPATGGLEAVGQAVSRVGAGIVEEVGRIDAQESAVEKSELLRKFKENYNALHSSITNDPAANKKLWDKFEGDSNALVGQAKHGSSQREFQIFLNNQLPDFKQAFDNKEQIVRQDAVRDNFKFNYQRLLGQGNTWDAANLLVEMKDTKAITEPEYGYYAANMFTDSALEMARVDIGEGRYEQAQKGLSELKDLNDNQLDQRDRLLADLNRIKDPQVEKDRVSIAEKIHDGSATFEFIQSTSLDQKEKNETEKWRQNVQRAAAKGEEIVTDQDSRIAANEVVLAYKDGTIQRKDALAGIVQYQSKINPTEFKQITDDIYNYADNPDPIKKRQISEYNKAFTYLASKNRLTPQANRQTNLLAAVEYQKAFNDWVKANPDASDIEIGEKFKNLTKTIDLWWDNPSRDLAVVRRRTQEIIPSPVSAQPIRPTDVPADATWDAGKQMWTYIRDGRLKGWK